MVGFRFECFQRLRLNQQLARILLGLAPQSSAGLVAVEAGWQRAEVQRGAILRVGEGEAAVLLFFVGQNQVNFLVIKSLENGVVGFRPERHVVLSTESILRGVHVEALFVGILGEELERADDEAVVGFGFVVVLHGLLQAPLPAAVGEQGGLAVVGRAAKYEQRLLGGQAAHALPKRGFGPGCEA